MQIAEHNFLITGGSSGLGRATAFHLAHQNANVTVADLNAEAGRQLVSELPGNAHYIHADVTDDSSIQLGLSQIMERYGTLHGLINCAGILVAERMINKNGSVFDLQHFRQCIEVNLVGTFNMIRLAGKIFSKNSANSDGERGVIVNTASIAAFEGQIGQAAYAASKAGVVGMTLPIARELGRLGIRVMTIAPGVFATPLFSEISEDRRNDLERQVPFPSRLGKPSEYATLVQHIIENPMLNGEVIRIDGALRMGSS